ncbi:MAG: Thiosulfate sulfurtransferase, rhodanese, partial [uncultured Thermomicrobiales bacterium]
WSLPPKHPTSSATPTPTCWSPPNGSPTTWTTRRCGSSSRTRTSCSTRSATFPAPSNWTGKRTCRTRSSAISSTRPASRRCSARPGLATTRPWFSTATRTTG